MAPSLYYLEVQEASCWYLEVLKAFQATKCASYTYRYTLFASSTSTHRPLLGVWRYIVYVEVHKANLKVRGAGGKKC